MADVAVVVTVTFFKLVDVSVFELTLDFNPSAERIPVFPLSTISASLIVIVPSEESDASTPLPVKAETKLESVVFWSIVIV